MAEQSKILVVDDSSVNNFLLENVLEDRGYKLQIAYNGKEALEFIDNDPPDLILLDIMMPGIDGYELLQRINKKYDEGLKKIPIIMVTAKSEEKDKAKSLELGAVDYVTKPIDIEELLARIKKTLS